MDDDSGVPVAIVERVGAVMTRFLGAADRVEVAELIAGVTAQPLDESWDAMTGRFFVGLADDERRALLVAIFTFLEDYDDPEAVLDESLL